MGNPATLRPKPFTSENNPRKGRPKGAKNRATLLKKWLSTPVELTHPVTKEKTSATVEDEVNLALISEARRGNVRAIQEINDSLYGKIPNNINLNVDELDTEIERRLAQLASGSEATSFGEAESESVN